MSEQTRKCISHSWHTSGAIHSQALNPKSVYIKGVLQHSDLSLCLCLRSGLHHCVFWMKQVWIVSVFLFFFLQRQKANDWSLRKLCFEGEDWFFLFPSKLMLLQLHSWHFTSPPTAHVGASNKLRWLCRCQFHCSFPAGPLARCRFEVTVLFFPAYSVKKVMDFFSCLCMQLYGIWEVRLLISLAGCTICGTCMQW